MRITHLSTYDTRGGAARGAWRIHESLRRLGHTSTMLVQARISNDPDVVRFVPDRRLGTRFHWWRQSRRIRDDFHAYADTRPPGNEIFSDDRAPTGKSLPRALPPSDVIVLHSVTEYVDYAAFFANLPAGVPVVWVLADMAPFTGGCHYSFDCTGFHQRCGACPQLGSTDSRDLSRDIWWRKCHALRRVPRGRLHIVATSHWMAEQVRNSSLLSDRPLSVVPLGLDVEDFAPRGRSSARTKLGVPANAQVVLFAAESLTNRRKGYAYLDKALAKLPIETLFLLSVGGGKPPARASLASKHMGRIEGDQLLSDVYSAADVYVTPALQEAFGQTSIESLACGTPVVGFDTGGIREIVRPGRTGQLAPLGSVTGLRQAIMEVLAHPDPAAMSAECRRIAETEYSLAAQGRAYESLFQSLISGASH
jgi:glycosyltransferase involved in cell wall biosynthesis